MSYYVSAIGNDNNDGLSAEKAFKSLDKINNLKLNPGDGVFFKRGDLWRGSGMAQKGITYSAYGKGEKPKIYGSPFDAAKQYKWVLTSVPNVYYLDYDLNKDVGTLVFNGGEACAFKVMKRRNQTTGETLHIETGEKFDNYKDLKRDLDFFHDYNGTKKIYLCSTKGIPSERFNSIELLEKQNIFSVRQNDVWIDNICLKYGGAHGIGCGKVDNTKLKNLNQSPICSSKI
ncbi:MAG: hypothetical protein Q4F97_07020 [Bacteroidales bacterium]|nr:hypothetical protein [Bacteroidales bacterium]